MHVEGAGLCGSWGQSRWRQTRVNFELPSEMGGDYAEGSGCPFVLVKPNVVTWATRNQEALCGERLGSPTHVDAVEEL